jgi:putative DNA-binding protein
MMRDNGNIVVYVDDNGQPQVDVRFQDETVWLTQAQLVELYQSNKANVSEYIKR